MERTLVAIDLSTKPGWALFHLDDDQIKSFKYDTEFPKKKIEDFGKYPLNYVKYADHIISTLVLHIGMLHVNHPDLEVVIEETNKGKNPYSQKILEFLHYSLIKGLAEKGILPKYIRTGVWRKFVGANLNADEKKLNQKISRIKKTTKTKLAKIDGKVVGRRTRKHAALRAFKEHFGQELPLKMEDACEACLLGLAYIRRAPVCDGTLKGGTLGSKE